MKKKKVVKYVPEQVKPNRPIIARVSPKEANDKFSTYPSNGLNPRRLASIFREADEGDTFRQMELFEEMEEKDTHLFSQLQTRKLAVTGLDWEVQEFSADLADKQIKDFVQSQLKSLNNFSDIMMDMLDAIGKGISFSEIDWDYDDGTVVISDIDHISPKKFFWDPLTDEIKVRTSDFLGGITLPENKYVIHKYKARSGHPSRAGVLRVVAWMYLFKNYDIKDWVGFCEVFGMPLRLGTYDVAASEDDKNALAEAIVSLGCDAAGIIPAGTKIEFIEANKQSSVDIYEKLARFCDEQISKAIVGQTLTADSGAGSYAQSKTHDEVRKDLTAADCISLMSTIRRDIITPLVCFNFGEDANIPYFIINSEDADNLKESAEIYKTLSETGLEIPKSFLYKKFNIPKPMEGEDFIGKKPTGTTQPDMTPYAMKDNPPLLSAQELIDQVADKATKQSASAFADMLEPILDLVDNCSSIESLQESLQEEQLSQLYKKMGSNNFNQLFEKVLYISNMIGRTQ